MNDQGRQEFINAEIIALYEELDSIICKLELLRPFFKDVVKVVNGEEPSSYRYSELSKQTE